MTQTLSICPSLPPRLKYHRLHTGERTERRRGLPLFLSLPLSPHGHTFVPTSLAKFSPLFRNAILPFFLSFPAASEMSHHVPSGLPTIPTTKSQCTPRFTSQDDDILSELHKYEDGNGLTEKQKAETIICYVPRSLYNLGVTLPGYRAAMYVGFHTDDQDTLEDTNPRHPGDDPFNIQDVLSAVQQYFATSPVANREQDSHAREEPRETEFPFIH